MRRGAVQEPLAAGLFRSPASALVPSFLAQAAKRFRPAETSRTSPGSGLGLSLVDAIAISPEARWAAVACHHPANGTTVSLLLPGETPA